MATDANLLRSHYYTNSTSNTPRLFSEDSGLLHGESGTGLSSHQSLTKSFRSHFSYTSLGAHSSVVRNGIDFGQEYSAYMADDNTIHGSVVGYEPREGQATLPSAVFNLCNTVIGAGVLALPFAFYQCGLILGSLALLVTFALTLYGSRLLIECALWPGHQSDSFRAVANAALGTFGMIITDLSLIVSCFGALTSYFVIVGDMLSPLFGLWMGGDDGCHWLARRWFSITLCPIVVTPWCLLRTIHTLRFPSFVALASILYLVIVVVSKSQPSLAPALLPCQGNSTSSKLSLEISPPVFGGEQGDPICLKLSDFSSSLFRALPIMTMAFTCTMNLCPILAELQRPTKQRATCFTTTSLALCLLVYLVVGAFGYLTFYDTVQGNILLNYVVDDIMVQIGRLAVALVALASFPVMAFPCIDAINRILFRRQEYSLRRTGAIVLCVVGAAYVIAMFVTDISVTLGLGGATGSMMISYILPPLFHVVLHHRTFYAPTVTSANFKTKARGLLQYIPQFCLCLTGLVFMAVCFIVTLDDALNGGSTKKSSSCS
eukprot:TRINITY_DN11351_c0_g1_i1.p1 TRINITY_DN11351_c0_g1~~TRINITY_DN11351_c0_g1_i1.p1  ORF type:complete len:546 (+),score=43.18 TRINITY_DN11351_c0_g1_i1:41-1678(+)